MTARRPATATPRPETSKKPRGRACNCTTKSIHALCFGKASVPRSLRTSLLYSDCRVALRRWVTAEQVLPPQLALTGFAFSRFFLSSVFAHFWHPISFLPLRPSQAVLLGVVGGLE